MTDDLDVRRVYASRGHVPHDVFDRGHPDPTDPLSTQAAMIRLDLESLGRKTGISRSLLERDDCHWSSIDDAVYTLAEGVEPVVADIS